jgi:hypothetical protein
MGLVLLQISWIFNFEGEGNLLSFDFNVHDIG